MIRINHEDVVLRAYMLFMQLTTAAAKYVDGRLYREHGLSMITYISLKGLMMNSGCLTHSGLARWTNTKKNNITALVERMKKEQLVTTERNEKDKRIIDIKITDKGRGLYEQASPTARNIMNTLMDGVGENDARELEKLCNVIKTNIERD
jgi:DNA-binding MarR family transcriptional regulator